MKESVGKKGLSPVIASVLLILLVLVLASIIFLWARGFIGEQIEKFGEPIEESCAAVQFDAARTGVAGELLEILNSGDIDIRYLEIRMTKGGESKTKTFDFPIDAGKVEIQTFSFSMSDTIEEEPDEIIVYPALLGKAAGDSSKVYTCLDSGVTL